MTSISRTQYLILFHKIVSMFTLKTALCNLLGFGTNMTLEDKNKYRFS